LRQGGATEELRELSSGRPPQQIHLEEAVLSMDKAQSACSVQSIRGADGRNTERIAVDKDRSTEAWDGARSVELRQARPELQTSPDRGGDHQRSADGGQREQCSAEPLPEKASALRRGRCGTCGRFVAHRNTFRVLPNAAAKNTRARQFTETRSALATLKEVIGEQIIVGSGRTRWNFGRLSTEFLTLSSSVGQHWRTQAE
jgi:hypothetical protein